MLFTLLFVTLYVLGWLALGFVPWLVLSVITRGHAGLRYLPLSMGAGVVGGLAVPILFRDDGLGLILSFVVALAAAHAAARDPARDAHPDDPNPGVT